MDQRDVPFEDLGQPDPWTEKVKAKGKECEIPESGSSIKERTSRAWGSLSCIYLDYALNICFRYDKTGLQPGFLWWHATKWALGRDNWLAAVG